MVDTGIGIAAHKLPSIFKPFVQLSDSAHKNGGSGLGLAIVHELVELMKGKIHIDSQEGAGTTVRVDLPLTPSRQGEFPELASGRPNEMRGTFNGLRVLVAEDNEINRIVAREHLEKLGCEVHTVINGLEAISACVQTRFQVVLMDCLMPVMDGFQATERILAQSALKNRPVIIGCTANASDKTTAMCLAAGMSSVVSKPYTRTQLAHELDSLLPGWMAGEAQPESPLILEQVVFDPMLLRSFDSKMGGGDLISQKLIAIFLEESKHQVDTTRAAIDQCDIGAMKRSAHALKGSASTLGLNALAELCGHLSSFESSTPPTAKVHADILAWGDRLLEEYSKALNALEAFRTQP